MRPITIVLSCAPLLAFCAGCASDRTAREPASYQELKQDELASERDEYIRDTQERLTEVDRDIQHVKAKLEHESEFVGQEKQASWKQDLFELEQDRAELGARLDRARSASPAEWEEMRGTLGTATDSLQAGVRKLRADVSEAMGLDRETAPTATESRVADDSGLCRVEMSGVEADVERAGNRVTVTLTTDEDKNVAELQRRASELAKSTKSYEVARQESKPQANPTATTKDPTATTKDPTAHDDPKVTPERVDVAVAVEKVEDGAKLTFTPKAAELEALRARLEQEAEHLEEGHCRTAELSLKTNND